MSIELDNSCFENIIGYDSGCTESASTSGLHASQVGITKKFISQIITSDFSGETDFHTKKLSAAVSDVVNSIHANLQPKYKAVSVVDNFKTGIFLENKQIVNAASVYKGIIFDLNSERSYLDFFISSLELFVNYSGTIPILIVDLLQGKILDTIDVTTVAGEIKTIYPAKLYSSKKRRLQLFIGYDASLIPSYKTVLRDSSCSSCIPTYRVRNSYETIMSATIPLTSSFIRSNVSSSNDSGGLSITHSLSCNHRDWLCTMSNLLAYPILYKYASLVFEFALTESPNERYNTSDTNNADLIKQRLDFANQKYIESISAVYQNMKIPQDEKCFECKQSNRHAIVLP